MKNTTVDVKPVTAASPNGRRNFLKMSGLALAGTGLLIAGCSDDDDNSNPMASNQLPGVRNGKFDLGGGDVGILTYAYALEQLEADFYTRVVNDAAFNTTFANEEERTILIDLYNHEVIHREFFKAAITGALAGSEGTLLPSLAFSYGGLSFSNRQKVLETAMTLEDTGVAAYNGAGQYLDSVTYLGLAGKIVSVEARHASAIRDILNGGTSFAGDDAVNAQGLDKALKPSQVIAAVGSLGLITTPFTAQFLQ
jgi:hypothetical protein